MVRGELSCVQYDNSGHVIHLSGFVGYTRLDSVSLLVSLLHVLQTCMHV